MENDEKTADLEQLDTQDQEVESTEETSEETTNQDLETSQEDDKDWKAEALKYKAILDRNKNKPEKKSESKKSDDLDYGAKAYLTANGIKGSKEFDFVKDELKKSGEDLDSLLENDYFKARLEKFRNLNKTTEAIPKGSKRSGVTTDSVEYWMSKPIEEVPQEMRIKVVNARLKKDESKGQFYNQK
ncbi:hypothetical protein K9M47_03120 [Candidatus Gracilibacteria bacterium]|nr:hypothetical protein [Candidatus Gracilibacteria bacterium]